MRNFSWNRCAASEHLAKDCKTQTGPGLLQHCGALDRECGSLSTGALVVGLDSRWQRDSAAPDRRLRVLRRQHLADLGGGVFGGKQAAFEHLAAVSPVVLSVLPRRRRG